MSTPLEDFFVQFASLGFEYRGNASAHKNFKRLQHVARWDDKSAALKEATFDFNDALTLQFNVSIGTGTDLASWQGLCKLIDITPIPDTIQECHQQVQNSHVNIVDLLESARTGKPVRKFPTVKELAAYTIKSRRIFPKQSAYAGGLLKELLREIFNSYRGKKRSGGGARKRRRARRKAAAEAAAAAQTSSS